MKRLFLNSVLLTTSALIGGLSAPVAAQAQDSAGTGRAAEAENGSDIIVTARRREERLQDVPLTVQAISPTTLQKLNIRDFKDVASLVPGLTLTPAADGVAPTSQLRGVNYNVNNSGNAGTLQFYLNDSPVPAANLYQSLYDVGQIEVLRGPQGTLRGKASPSGSITVTTRRPDLEQIGGYFAATATNLGGINVNGAANLPIVKDVLAIRLAGIIDNNESNRVRSLNNPSFQPYEHNRGERASVLFRPTDSIEIFGSYQHYLTKFSYFDQVESGNLAGPTTLPNGTPYVTSAGAVLITPGMRAAMENTPRNIRGNYNAYNLQAKWDFAGQRLSYVGGWTKFHVRSQSPADVGGIFSPLSRASVGFPLPGFNAVGSSFGGSTNTDPNSNPTFANFGQVTDVTATAQTHEIRLSNVERLFGMVDYVVGGMIDRSTSYNNPLTVRTPLFARVPFVASLNPFVVVPVVLPPSTFGCSAFQPVDSPIGPYCFGGLDAIFRSRDLEKSVFGNVTVHLGEATEISAGLRYIHHNGISFTQRPDGVTNILAPLNDTASTTIYSASIKHRFNENIMAYASTGSAFRVPPNTNPIIAGLGGDYDFSADPVLSQYFKKAINEKSKSYEIGIKTDWLDKRLQLNVAYYHQTFKDFIYSGSPVSFLNGLAGPAGRQVDPGPQSSGFTVPVPAKVDGVEAEFAFHPSHNFSLDGTFSYSLAKITGGIIPCPPTAASPLTPTHLMNFCPGAGRAGPSAPFSMTAQAEYNRAVTQNVEGFFRTQLSWYGNSQNDPLNPIDDIKAYARVNLFAGLREADGAWELTAYVKNVFNVQRVLARNLVPAGVSSTVNFYSDYRGIRMTPPREFGLTMRYSFGSR